MCVFCLCFSAFHFGLVACCFVDLWLVRWIHSNWLVIRKVPSLRRNFPAPSSASFSFSAQFIRMTFLPHLLTLCHLTPSKVTSLIELPIMIIILFSRHQGKKITLQLYGASHYHKLRNLATLGWRLYAFEMITAFLNHQPYGLYVATHFQQSLISCLVLTPPT